MFPQNLIIKKSARLCGGFSGSAKYGSFGNWAKQNNREMNLKSKITEDQKRALKSGDALRLSVLRMLAAAVANKEIELRKKDVGLSDPEVLEAVLSEAKRRKDAAAEYKKGGREDLAKKEEAELKILQEYLPPEISDEDLVRIIESGIREAGIQPGADSEKDFGKVMKTIMPTLKNKASGDRISKMLKAKLSQLS